MAFADDEDPVADIDVHHVPNALRVSFHLLVHHIVVGVGASDGSFEAAFEVPLVALVAFHMRSSVTALGTPGNCVVAKYFRILTA